MQVTATMHIPGVTVSNFVDQGDGSYIATITAGTYSGSGPVWVTINNGDAAVTLLSELLALTAVPEVRTSGGCTVATGRAMDSSMILVMLVLLLLRFRRRGALNVSS
jgi:MYXO-CTERM domain-containing protein